MNIIIAGDGKVGSTLTKQLSSEGHDITLIDLNSQVLNSIVEQYDVIGICGNCASMETLRAAGIDNTDLLIAATGADEVNLLCCLTAHGLNRNLHTIARVRNPEYSNQLYSMRDFFALSLAVNPDKQAAAEIERLLSFPGFIRRNSFAKGRVEIVELRVDEHSKLNNVALSKLAGVVNSHVLVCTVVRDGVASMPGGDFVLQEDDHVYVAAPTAELANLLKNLGVITHKVNKVMLAGGGRISYYLAEQLLNSDMDVRIIEKDPDRCVELAGLLPKASVIQGDASSPKVLESEGAAECDALVSLTGLDEMNMVISLYGSNMHIQQVVTKFGHIDSTSVLDNLAIGSVIFPKELCCSTIVRYVRALQNQTGAALSLHNIAGGQAEAIEFRVDDDTKHCGELLKNVHLHKDVIIVSIIHDGVTELPNGSSTFHKGDTLIVVVKAGRVIHQLNEIFV